MFLCFAFAACEKENTNPGGDNGGGNNNGPVITDDDIGIELNMSNNGDDKIYFTIFRPDYANTTFSCYIKMSSSNNFVLGTDWSGDIIDYDIASVGHVTGLSSINTIPTSGWVKQIAVNLGTGYIIRYKSGGPYTNVRLYVKDWIVSTGGGIIGAIVVYQDKWGQESNEEEAVEDGKKH